MSVRNWLLVCDLDGTLLGHDESLLEFEMWSRKVENVTIVYATGRSLDSVKECLVTTSLPVPDFLIANIGTEVWEMPTETAVFHWPRLEGKNWNIARIMKYMRTVPDAELQPLHFQTPWKVSYYVKNFARDKIQRIVDELSQFGLEFEIVYSGERFLDFLPRESHKGAAVETLANHLQIPKERTVVAGDSGNDISMFERGYRNILVGNAQAELLTTEFTNTYRAKESYAAGVLEGLVYWGVALPESIRAR